MTNNINEFILQLKGLIAYYGENATLKEVIENEIKIGKAIE